MYEDGYVQVLSMEQSAQLDENEWWIRPAILENRCQRCNQRIDSRYILPNNTLYCPYCIQFGRLTQNEALCSKKARPTSPRKAICTWTGKLTKNQQTVANQLRKCLEQHHHALVWAVTGAGKTEMLFELILTFLKSGKRVAISSPRIDVCLELYPRICQAFSDEDVYLMYGDAKEIYREHTLIVCTTHQLIHFYQAFDLLIIDEIDAFPYEGDEILHFASVQCLKEGGMNVLLTATPPNHLLRRLTTLDHYEIIKLPIRFHQRPLIVPKLVYNEHCDNLTQHPLAARRYLQLISQLVKKWHVLIFCPSIAYTSELCQFTKKHLPQIAMTDVSAVDPNRQIKVQKLRQHEYELFFTTTILERGVTINEVAVLVIAAHHKVYSKSALVQIAGRADRKGQKVNGDVYFLLNEYTPAIKQACKEISEMNRLARELIENEV